MKLIVFKVFIMIIWWQFLLLLICKVFKIVFFSLCGSWKLLLFTSFSWLMTLKLKDWVQLNTEKTIAWLFHSIITIYLYYYYVTVTTMIFILLIDFNWQISRNIFFVVTIIANAVKLNIISYWTWSIVLFFSMLVSW